jgi:hypothetical protein
MTVDPGLVLDPVYPVPHVNLEMACVQRRLTTEATIGDRSRQGRYQCTIPGISGDRLNAFARSSRPGPAQWSQRAGYNRPGAP